MSGLQSLPTPALAVVNHLLGQASWARKRLAPYAGHAARFSMPPFEAAFQVIEGGLLAAASAEAVPEVSIALPATAPLLALQGNDAVMRAARIDGSVDFAEALGHVIRNLRWEVEEDLSRLIGDTAAHGVAMGARRFIAGQRKAAHNLAENVAEYLTEEAEMVARRDAIADFGDEIDRLRDDVARLEKRVQRLR